MRKHVVRYTWLFALGLALSGCGVDESEVGDEFQTVEVTRGALRITAEATGTVEPIRKVEVKSKASGEILALAVDVGDQVEAGALLARIDPRDVRNSFDQARADLEVAQARLEISEAQARRSRELVDAGVITEQEYENSRLDLANAQAGLIKAQTNLELAEAQLGDVTITAPLAGTILSKSVEEGQVIQSASQNVSGGTRLFEMADLLKMQVRTLVDETDMGQIRAGMDAVVQVEAFRDWQFRAYVEKVEPQAVVQQNVTMFPVIVRLDNREGMLRPGMNAEVEVLVDQANGILLVPNNAIVLPQDLSAAAIVLGLEPEQLDMTALGIRRPGAGSGPRTTVRDGLGEPPLSAAPSGPESRMEGRAVTGRERGVLAGTAPDSLQGRVFRGGLNRDSLRGLMPGARGAEAAVRGGASAREFAVRPGVADRAEATRGVVTLQPELRRAVVFVVDEGGVPTPRPVEIGLNDYDLTEVVSGLDEGERVAMLGAAQLQAQNQAFLDRIRERSSMFGGGMRFGRR